MDQLLNTHEPQFATMQGSVCLSCEAKLPKRPRKLLGRVASHLVLLALAREVVQEGFPLCGTSRRRTPLYPESCLWPMSMSSAGVGDEDLHIAATPAKRTGGREQGIASHNSLSLSLQSFFAHLLDELSGTCVPKFLTPRGFRTSRPMSSKFTRETPVAFHRRVFTALFALAGTPRTRRRGTKTAHRLAACLASRPAKNNGRQG